MSFSTKQTITTINNKNQAKSNKQQATSNKQQATNNKQSTNTTINKQTTKRVISNYVRAFNELSLFGIVSLIHLHRNIWNFDGRVVALFAVSTMARYVHDLSSVAERGVTLGITSTGIFTNLVVNENLNLKSYSHFWVEVNDEKKFKNPFSKGVLYNFIDFWFGGVSSYPTEN